MKVILLCDWLIGFWFEDFLKEAIREIVIRLISYKGTCKEFISARKWNEHHIANDKQKKLLSVCNAKIIEKIKNKQTFNSHMTATDKHTNNICHEMNKIMIIINSGEKRKILLKTADTGQSKSFAFNVLAVLFSHLFNFRFWCSKLSDVQN